MGLQSEPLLVQPVSFVRGGLRLPDPATVANAKSVIAQVRPLRVGTSTDPVMLVGRGAESNLNWALDATIQPGATFNWNLSDVVIPTRLTASQIGIYATVATESGPRSTSYLIPVEISVPGAVPPARPDLELLIRIPGAAAARWWIDANRPPRPAETLNADGFFRIWLPADLPAGATRLAISWRPRGQRGFTSVPDLLRLLLPTP